MDCDSLATSFSYIVDASMPVSGPTTTASLRGSHGEGAEKLSASTLAVTAMMSAKLANLF